MGERIGQWGGAGMGKGTASCEVVDGGWRKDNGIRGRGELGRKKGQLVPFNPRIVFLFLRTHVALGGKKTPHV